MTARLSWAAFTLGAAVIAWVGAGYVRHHPLAFTVTALIGLTFVVGAVELHRFRRATAGLARALADLPADLPADPAAQLPADQPRLADWLASAVPAALRPAVRLRVEGERVALPGPALTPYLVGLLVLLGMLGTFLGLVVTLDGAVKALETTTDLATIRAALSAPVKGLGLAFGTSVAGVAGSAMLGLMSTLARRERAEAGQALDARAAGPLRRFSAAAVREATLATLQQQNALLQQQHEALLRQGEALQRQTEAMQQQGAAMQRQGELVQRQAEALPALAADLHRQMLTQMQALAEQLGAQHAALNQGLLGGQTAFHDDTRRVYGALADSVGSALRDGLAAGARAAGETIQPLAEATMAAIARDATRLQAEVAATVASQLGAVSTRLEGSVAALEAAWSGALARHGEGSAQLIERLGTLVDGFTARQAEQSAALLAAVQAAQAAGQQALAATLADLARRTQAAQAEVLAATEALQARAAGQAEALHARVAGQAEALHARVTEAAQAQLGQAAERLAGQSGALLDGLQRQQAALVDTLQRSQAGLVAELQQGQAALREDLAARDQARQQALADGLATLSATLTSAWRAAGEDTLAQQTRLCSLLETSAREIHARADAQTQAAVAEVGRLLQAAGEAPRAAAEAIGELRQALSTSLTQDNAALAERQRLLDTLATLLDAIEQSAGRQRGAVDALVASAEALLARTGEQAGRQLADGAERLDAVAAQVTGSAAEVASLGEAFGVAVERFTAATEALGSGLQRIEAALAASMARSDEQLAYYVAQAREVIDLSLMAQQRLVDELQHGGRTAVATNPATVTATTAPAAPAPMPGAPAMPASEATPSA